MGGPDTALRLLVTNLLDECIGDYATGETIRGRIIGQLAATEISRSVVVPVRGGTAISPRADRLKRLNGAYIQIKVYAPLVEIRYAQIL
jgi:hypothetical protein